MSGTADERPHHVKFGPPCHGSGSYTRHEGDSAITLLRYDRQASPPHRGAHLTADGRWHTDERPDRIVWRGSDHGEPVTPDQASEIAAEMGHHPAVLHEAV